MADRCSANKVITGVTDDTDHHGALVLSELAQDIEATFCGRCFRGTVSAGLPGVRERAVLLKALGGVRATLSSAWSPHKPVTSLLVLGTSDGHKREAVRGVVSWLEVRLGVKVEEKRVHYFDDNDASVQAFNETDFNARQVSCAPRDAERLGLCGARLVEVTEDVGVFTCLKGTVSVDPAA